MPTAVLLVLKPFPVVNLAVGPLESAFTVFLVVQIMPQEQTAVRVNLIPLPTLYSALELALEHLP